MDTINQILQKTQQGEDFYLLLGDFLDEFYGASNEKKILMITEKPTDSALNTSTEYLCFAAATTHKLANDYQLAVPDWVFDKRFYMKEKPFFACGARGNLRLLFMYKAPAEFKHRNMFVDENVLKRV